MRNLKSGQPAPDLTLKTIDDNEVKLSEQWRNQHLVLVFLRHLGWLPWRDHVAQLRERYETIKSISAEVVVVSFGNPFWVNVWLEQTQAPFPLLLDQERAAYAAYGLEASKARSWGLNNLWYYAKAKLQGRELPQATGEDTDQLGGDFIVDRQGILRYVHPSREPTDRPPMETLLSALNRIEAA